MTREQVDELVKEFRAAKRARHYVHADQISDELRGQGIEITPSGWRWLRWRTIAVTSILSGDFKIERTVGEVSEQSSGQTIRK